MPTGSTSASAATASRLSEAEADELQEIVNSLAITAASRGEIQGAHIWAIYHRFLDFQARMLGQQV